MGSYFCSNPKVVLKSSVTISAPVTNSILCGGKRIFFRSTYNPTHYKIGENDAVVNIGANIENLYTLCQQRINII